MYYSFTDWLLFFFFYSFLGWIWESAYASVGQKRFVNRGFLHGPMIPIYGFGALGVLACTIGVRQSIPLIFIFGMIGATALEYATGWGMEKLFHVKYWDYSNFPFNVHGYICLFASLGWGAFSVLLIDFIHPPIEHAVLGLPRTASEVMVFFLSCAAAADTRQSANEALDLRDILEKLAESKEQIGRLQRRLEIRQTLKLAEYKERLKSAGERIPVSAAFKDRFAQNLQLARSLRKKQLDELLTKIAAAGEQSGISREELLKLRGSVLSELQRLGARSDRSYRNVARILRRNPRAISQRYQDALKEIREMMGNE